MTQHAKLYNFSSPRIPIIFRLIARKWLFNRWFVQIPKNWSSRNVFSKVQPRTWCAQLWLNTQQPNFMGKSHSLVPIIMIPFSTPSFYIRHARVFIISPNSLFLCLISVGVFLPCAESGKGVLPLNRDVRWKFSRIYFFDKAKNKTFNRYNIESDSM